MSRPDTAGPGTIYTFRNTHGFRQRITAHGKNHEPTGTFFHNRIPGYFLLYYSIAIRHRNKMSGKRVRRPLSQQAAGIYHKLYFGCCADDFLNGTAVDDLTVPLSGEEPILALSAAMPGLAGAIFRRNSFHAALRTTPDKKTENTESAHITVTLKLFNSIASERGPELLKKSVIIKTGHLTNFLAKRPSLPSLVKHVVFSGKTVSMENLAPLTADFPRLKLNIITTHD